MIRACAVLLLAACAAPPPTGDPPDFLDAGDLAPAVLLSAPVRGIASGVVIAPDVVLTCAHVLGMFPTEPPLELGVSRLDVRAEVLEQGAPESAWRDWALLRTSVEVCPAESLAWVATSDQPPAPGTEAWVIGYPSALYSERGVDLRLPPRVLRATFDEPDEDGWVLGREGRDLGGLSGGGIFVWNAAAARLELVGLCVGQIETARRLEGPLGLSVPLSRDKRMRGTPIPRAAVAHASRRVAGG